MDNNNPTNPQPGATPISPEPVQTPAANAPGAPTAAAPAISTPQSGSTITLNVGQPGTTPPSPGGNKMMLILVVGIVFIVLLFGGVYWYMSSKQPKETATTTESVQPTAQPTLSQLLQTLDDELNSIEVQAADSDFATTIDPDIQSL